MAANSFRAQVKAKTEDLISTSVTLKLRSPSEAMLLFGQNDENLKLLRDRLSAKVVARGDEVRLSGSASEVAEAEQTFRSLLANIRRGEELSTTELKHVKLDELIEQQPSYGSISDHLPKRARPKTAGQRRYVEAIYHHSLTFGMGPAGTGKTYLAVAMAIIALKDKKVKRIILTRPAVEAGEKLGFLPGDMQAKIDPYLRPLYDALYDILEGERFDHLIENGTIEVAPLGFMRGRAQPVDRKVLTPFGWREIGALEVGDAVIGKNGKPTQVLGIYPQGQKEVFRITLTDDSSTLACAEHLWEVQTPSDKRSDKRRIVQTSDMIESLKQSHQHRYELPLVDAVEFPKQTVPLDAYALGLLLGDGCLTGSTTPSFATTDPELAQALEDHIPEIQLYRKSDIDYVVQRKGGGGRGGVITANPLTAVLRDLNLCGVYSSTKFIPPIYLYNSSEVRLGVLQGLLDTDGGPVTQAGRTCRIQYSTTSKQLCDDVTFLVRSLGGVTYSRTRKAEHKQSGFARGREIVHRSDSYCLDIRLPSDVKPFRLTRKADLYETHGSGRPMHFVKKIENVGLAESVCIQVAASDHLYVTDDFIVTHNTLNDAFIILDEAQNTTSEQMKMFLTRMGFNSKVVVTGDTTQTDLPHHIKSGLRTAEQILKNIEGISFIHFSESDVVRHPLVASIVKAYDQDSNASSKHNS
jgi:phosphate starvation-inducible protein PhoH and related proteins